MMRYVCQCHKQMFQISGDPLTSISSTIEHGTSHFTSPLFIPLGALAVHVLLVTNGPAKVMAAANRPAPVINSIK